MKRTTMGLRPNIFMTLNSSLLLVAMLFLFASCGGDDDNANPNANYPQQCINPQTNQPYTCYPGDVNYPNYQNGGQYGYPGYNGTGTAMTIDQLRTTFTAMAMNTNTPAESSILLNTSFFGSEVHVVKSADATNAQIEIVDGNGYDVIEDFSLSKTEVLENIFGEQQSYTSNYQIYPVQICLMGSNSGYGYQPRVVNGYVVEEYYTNYSGFFQATSLKSRAVISTEIPFFANPLQSQGLGDNRTVIQLNREQVSIGCGY